MTWTHFWTVVVAVVVVTLVVVVGALMDALETERAAHGPVMQIEKPDSVGAQ